MRDARGRKAAESMSSRPSGRSAGGMPPAVDGVLPRRLRLSPGRRLLHALALLAITGAVLAFVPGGSLGFSLWLVPATLLALAALLDAALAWRGLPPEVLSATRQLPHALALGVERRVAVTVRNAGRRRLVLTAFDHVPPGLVQSDLPAILALAPASETTFYYRVLPQRRGPADFGRLEVLADSVLGLWRRRHWLAQAVQIRVYPNFAAVARYALLATDHRLSRVGVRLRRRRGEGMEFHQLREYRRGDSLRQVDWKATTRQRKLISREYQDERDQRLVFLLDSSRRMRAQDGGLSHFDEALNSMMLLAHVALRQGDSVGAMSFGQAPGGDRFHAPDKGGSALDQLTNTFYDLEPQPRTGDYLEAAKALMRRVPKRSMVILLTNLRDEDEDELALALRVLRAKHLVVLASLRETVLDQVTESRVERFEDALTVAAGHAYLAARERTFSRLVGHDMFALDVTPSGLPIALVNKYLEIKRSGRL